MGKAINQNLPNVHNRDKIIHEPEGKREFRKLLSHFLTWLVHFRVFFSKFTQHSKPSL